MAFENVVLFFYEAEQERTPEGWLSAQDTNKVVAIQSALREPLDQFIGQGNFKFKLIKNEQSFLDELGKQFQKPMMGVTVTKEPRPPEYGNCLVILHSEVMSAADLARTFFREALITALYRATGESDE